MKISETVGIDVSKLVIDVRIHSTQAYAQFENSISGIDKMCEWSYKNTNFSKEEILFVFEHTGLYSYNLAKQLTEKDIPFAMVPGLEIKRSLGISRGKNDKVDATKIARYAYRLRDEIQPYKMPTNELQKLKTLLTLRDRLVKHRSGYKTSLKEQRRVLNDEENTVLFNTQQEMINSLNKQIAIIENELDNIINKSLILKELLELILTIKSVGKQTALNMIVYTAGFNKFKNARKFASYCGIAPFPNLSGTSIIGRAKVNNLANKKIKSLLDQCAKSAIVHNVEMRNYYEKRIAKGKSKMSTINIIRNKLLARIFAVVNRKTPYVDVLKYAA